MKKIGLISDTHNYFDDSLRTFLEPCDEIWHAGDVGNYELLLMLESWKPTRAVYGNIDGHQIRMACPEILYFKCEEVSILMTHMGGYPGHYQPKMKNIIKEKRPKLYISGHSHILRVMYDKAYDLLHINPGAAGIEGFHKVRTAVRFIIDMSDIKQLEIWEKERG